MQPIRNWIYTYREQTPAEQKRSIEHQIAATEGRIKEERRRLVNLRKRLAGF